MEAYSYRTAYMLNLRTIALAATTTHILTPLRPLISLAWNPCLLPRLYAYRIERLHNHPGHMPVLASCPRSPVPLLFEE